MSRNTRGEVQVSFITNGKRVYGVEIQRRVNGKTIERVRFGIEHAAYVRAALTLPVAEEEANR